MFQTPNLSFRLQGRDLAHWEMVKNGTKSAGNLQAGAAGEMDLQNHGIPQKNPGQPAFAEITLPQPKQTTVPAVTVRCSGMEADIYNGADAAVIETVLRILKSC